MKGNVGRRKGVGKRRERYEENGKESKAMERGKQ